MWTDVLNHIGERFTAVWYDVKVGQATTVACDVPAWEQRIREGCWGKRIDAIVQEGVTMWVVEVKPYGNHAALGQVLLYRDLFVRRHPEYQDVRMAIACSSVDEDLSGVLTRYHVSTWIPVDHTEAYRGLPEVDG